MGARASSHAHFIAAEPEQDTCEWGQQPPSGPYLRERNYLQGVPGKTGTVDGYHEKYTFPLKDVSQTTEKETGRGPNAASVLFA